MTNNRPDIDAEIAARIDSMDFEVSPATPTRPAQELPRAVYLKPPANGIATVYSIDDDTWKSDDGIGSRSTAEAALAYALNPPKTPQWDYGGRTGDGWKWYSHDEYYRDVGNTRACVKLTAGGWVSEVRTHTVQGNFKTPEEAIAAANKTLAARFFQRSWESRRWD